MSSILKALKKLEAEQAGRAEEKTGSGGHYMVRSHGGRRTALLLFGGVSLGLLLAAAMILLVATPSPPASPRQSSGAAGPDALPVAAAPTSQPALPVVPAPARPPVTNNQVAAAPSLAPVDQPLPLPPPAPIPVLSAAAAPVPAAAEQRNGTTAAAVPRGILAAADRSDRNPVPSVSRPPEEAQTPAVPASSPERIEHTQVERREIPLPGQQWVAPHLIVSEIFPAEGGSRMAIVNDLPVMEGILVDNALVEEILADRVRFVIDGKVVEVRLSPAP